MRKQILIAAVISICCLGAGLANAQYYWGPPQGAGPYFRAGIGPTFYQTGTLRSYTSEGGGGQLGPGNQPVKYDTGFGFDAALGYAFNKYVSLDGEIGVIWGQIDNIPGYYVNNTTIDQVPFMGNVTFSLPIPHTIIVPYIGAGGGGAVSELNADNLAPQANPGNWVDGNESDTVFAYQGFAGVRFMLSPNVSVGVAYKYFATSNPTFSYPGPGPDWDVNFKGVQTHSVLFTVNWNFW